MSNDQTCEYCDKRGVPILPLRYAVAPAGAPLPKATKVGVALPDSAGIYTRRLLRSGYLYVFDEARKRWDDYFVTADGYFFRLHAQPGGTPILPQKPFSCPDLGHAAVASCITIPDAKRATKVWLGFSDVQWTEAIRKQHASEAVRKRHMRCVDVKSFTASADKAHCLAIGKVNEEVAEYAREDAALKKSLSHSPFPVNARTGRAERLVKECQRMAPEKGFAVVLNDPAGIAAELGQLMQHEFTAFTGRAEFKHKLATSNTIMQIETAVREQAIQAEIQAAEDLANQQVSHNPLGHWLSESTRKRTEDLRDVTPAEERRAADHTWAKYSAKFQEAQAKQWRAEFNGKLKTFDETRIVPLAKAHTEWMKSAEIAAAFECNFDSTDAECGVAYAKALNLCIGSTQDKAACFDLYTQWLDGSLTDKTNLLLRAMVLNLDATANQVQTAAKVNLDWRGFPLDQISGNFGEAAKHVSEGRADAVGRLLQSVGGPLSKWLALAVDGRVRAGMVALGLNTGMTFVVVELTGGKKAFRAALIRTLIRESGQQVNAHQMQRAVSAKLRQLQLAGVPLEGTDKKKFVLMVDPEAAAGMPKGTASQRATWLAGAIRTPEQFETLKQSHWRARLSNRGAGAALLKSGIPVVTAMVGAVLQYNAMQKLAEDDGKAMKHEATEALSRLHAGVMAFGGTIVELVGMGLGKTAILLPRFARGLNFAAFGLGIFGKAVGFLGALFMAWLDLQKADEAKREGQLGLVWAYRASAGLGVLAAIALLAGWTGIGLILVGLLIAVALIIEYFKDNKLQDWLERCQWGKGPGARYKTVEEELSEFKKAIA